MCGWVLQSEEDKHGTPASMDEKWCGKKGNCKMMKMEKTLFMFNTFVFSYFHQFFWFSHLAHGMTPHPSTCPTAVMIIVNLAH